MPDGSTDKRQKTACRHCPIRKRKIFRQFNEKELDFVSSFKTGELTVEAGSTILLEENKTPHIYTILEGWAFRHKSLPDGHRQILNFAFPGDLLGLQMALMDEMQHSVTALTTTRLCVFQRDKVWSVFTGYPTLSFSMTWLAAREEQMLDAHLLNVGQRPALERAAFLLLHLYDRAVAVGYAGNNTMRAPFNQSHLADALGITPVHANRTLKKLYDRNIIRWTDSTVTLIDRERMESLSGYERDEEEVRPLI